MSARADIKLTPANVRFISYKYFNTFLDKCQSIFKDFDLFAKIANLSIFFGKNEKNHKKI